MKLRSPLARPALVLYGYRAAAGLVIAYPMARMVGSFGASSHPLGDRTLFTIGGVHLVDTLRLGGSAIGAALEGGTVIGAITALAGLVPLGVVLALLVDPDARGSAAAMRSLELFSTFVAITGATLFAQGLAGAATFAVCGVLSSLTANMADERARQLLALTPVPLAALLLLAMGMIEDLARATSAATGARAVEAFRAAWTAFRERRNALVGVYAACAGAGAATVAAAAAATGAIDVSRPGTARVGAVLAVHQVALLAIAALRVLWLRTALSAVAGAQPIGNRLPVDLNVATSGAIPAEIEPHDTAP